MYGSTGQPFFSPEGMGDLHKPVVHDNRQMIGGHAIRLQQYFIVEAGSRKMDFSPDEVREAYVFTGIDLDPDDMGRAGRQQLLHFFGGKGERILHFLPYYVVVLGGVSFGV